VADDGQITGGGHFKLDLGGSESALLFTAASLPSGSLQVPAFKTADANGNPVNSLGGGTQVQWGDVVLTRCVDTDHSLYEWFKSVQEKGVTDDTKKDIKIITMDPAGETLSTWNIVGAVISSYSMSGVDAQTQAILTEQVSISFQDATLE
jgi:phage tail-like protein